MYPRNQLKNCGATFLIGFENKLLLMNSVSNAYACNAEEMASVFDRCKQGSLTYFADFCYI
ncbi:hypothetical protein A8C56_05155 [Niabella ginsenosidivorans]|uniref:Uncharacterized protein n=1 Tax=Niabella ginsenosidivorans TaxID=1176587 RepID=A0A1A9I060_9BACT|nr:hypothetical protein A8C56_05155 [Niabella ginsenosidivorans]